MFKRIFFAGLSLCLYTTAVGQDSNPVANLSGKELFGDIKARQIGPALMSGRVTDLEPHPTDARVLYVGTAGGGVWKSSDGGATVYSVFDEHPQSIGNIAVDPNNPQTVWVGTGEIWTRNSTSVGYGLYKTTDGGNNWDEVPGFEKSERISSIEINPNNSDEIYIGVLGALWGNSENRGVYKTTDAGKTWNKIFYIGPGTGVSDLVMDLNNPNILYASMWEFRRTGWSFNSGGDKSALYKSTDGGKNWKKIHKGFPSGKLGRIAFAMAPSNSQILYTAIEAEKDSEKGLYRSDDGGASWKHLNNDFGIVVRPFYFSRIVVDPRNPDILVKGGLFGSLSRDGGKTFKSLGNMHADIHDIMYDIKDSDRMYVGTDGGLYRSWDAGTTMEMVENMPVSQFYHIDVDDKTPYNVYGGLQDNGSWYGPTSSPGGVEARDWNRIGYGDGFRVLKHPTKDIIYSEMQGAENVWRYDIKKNQQKTVQPLKAEGDPKLRFNWNAPMTTSAHKPDRLYIGSQFVHRSDDMGDTWEKVSPDLTTNDPKKQNQENSGGLSKDNSGAENHTTIFTIAESPLDENILWVGTDDGNVQLTTDGGKKWKNLVENIEGLPKNTWVYHIEASHHDKGTAYAVFDGHTKNDMNTYVYKTSDYGKTWKSLATPNIEGFARAFQEDLKNPNLLFLGTELGLYISIDGGGSWKKFTNNFPATAVHYLTMQKNTLDLVAGTHGRGVIIIDDVAILRELTPENLEKDVHFFSTKPAMMMEESGFGGTSTETQFVGPNPSRQAVISYYLKKRHTFGKMTMEIQDMDGNLISEIGPNKSRGINIVTWNYATRQPKVAKGKSFAYGGFVSPNVEAGTYKAVLKKGKETYETEFTVLNDSTSLITPEERKMNREFTMELYNMTEQLAYMVYEIDETIATAEKLKKADPAAAKTAQAVIDDLNGLKKTLVTTTGDNYVGRAENELREDMLDLYSKIATRFDKPTPAEYDNLKVVVDEYSEAQKKFEKIKDGSVKKMQKQLEKSEMDSPEIESFESFIKG
ncbi:WD40/YVTN/BNR-like repeat-containing protein [Owenweeksia hongkongensis]|uniref:WD40/YVTN/BNR-like repeat-containing protein n=1 Tax=Owenweeksia hongkongensis TaxID=253245 RepID=UPI003A948017